MIVQGRYSRSPDARSGRLQTKRRGRRSVAVHAGEHHEQHGAIVVGDHGAIAEVRLEVLGVGRRGVFSPFLLPLRRLVPAAAPFGRFALSPASICAGRLRGGGGGGTWPGGQPREAAASRAYTSPRTRCTGSSDPADRYATAVSFAFGSWRTPSRRTGQARRPPEAGRRRSPRRARGGDRRRGHGHRGRRHLEPGGEAMRVELEERRHLGHLQRRRLNAIEQRLYLHQRGGMRVLVRWVHGEGRALRQG